MDESRLEAEHGKSDHRDSSDEEEISLFPHRKGADEPDPPGSDIRDGPSKSVSMWHMSKVMGKKNDFHICTAGHFPQVCQLGTLLIYDL